MAVRTRPVRARRSSGALVWWADPDRRRAALLSGALHLVVLLLMLSAFSFPTPEPPPTYLVIDIGSPAIAETPVEAPAADAPAPATETPQVADVEVGAPQAAATPEPLPTAPEPAPQLAQPEAPAAAPAAPEAVTTPTPRPPVPAPMTPMAAAPEIPLAPLPATALPEVALPDIEPTPLADRIAVPVPTVAALVPEPRAIAATPQVTVAESAPVPLPQVAAQIEAAAPVPVPSAAVATAAARPVAQPDVRAEVATARDVRVVPQVVVDAPRPVPTPQVAAVVAPRPPAPSAPAVDPSAAAAATETTSAIDAAATAGGDAANPGQTGPPDPDADAGALGLAASPDGVELPTGSPAQPRVPFTQTLDRPLAVLVDNAIGVPISGIRPASMVVEMPVEGGLTRLMLVFDRSDPGRVGPVRSSRPYFVELATRMDAVQVHDGGSPDALAAIAASRTPTFNAYQRGDLFSRGDGVAPYNLFSAGDLLRAAMNRLDLGRGRTISGTIFRAPPETPEVGDVAVGFGSPYRSAFRYDPALNAYRWVRDGVVAVDAAGEAVVVDAVLVGAIEARVIPDDPYGRLSIPLRGGPATLFLGGRAVEGRWEPRDVVGVAFVTATGELVDLAPFKTWLALTPAYPGAN